MTATIPPRLMEIIDERVFEFAQGAQRHFATNDLMVLLDFREKVAELEAIPRQRFVAAEELPAALRLKFARPASDIKQLLGAPNQSFWFLVMFEDGDFECAAIAASLMAPGGTA